MRRIYLLPHANKIIHVKTIAYLRVGNRGSVHGSEFICKCIPVPFYSPPFCDEFQKKKRTVQVFSQTNQPGYSDCPGCGNLCEPDCLRFKIRKASGELYFMNRVVPSSSINSQASLISPPVIRLRRATERSFPYISLTASPMEEYIFFIKRIPFLLIFL